MYIYIYICMQSHPIKTYRHNCTFSFLFYLFVPFPSSHQVDFGLEYSKGYGMER